MISSFDGDNRFLSNFWPARVEFEGVAYPTVEHAYVAAKTTNTYLRERVLRHSDPGGAKRFGRVLPLRPDWENVKVPVMRDLVHKKFQIEALRNRLIETMGQELVEGNHWGDTFWGVDLRNNFGCNQLGIILMDERERIWREITI